MLALTRCGVAVIKKHSLSFAICIGRTDLLDPLGPGLRWAFLFFWSLWAHTVVLFFRDKPAGPGPIGIIDLSGPVEPGPH
jgi:hypothetical protein